MSIVKSLVVQYTARHAAQMHIKKVSGQRKKERRLLTLGAQDQGTGLAGIGAEDSNEILDASL
jgi:hypothetical protein